MILVGHRASGVVLWSADHGIAMRRLKEESGGVVRPLPKRRPLSAGILLYRRRGHGTEVLLGHPGGPYWTRKDKGAWMVPKGAVELGESSAEAARREFGEEVGPVPPGALEPLARVRQNGGKLVEVFALEGDFDPQALASNEFEQEWPPRSGRMMTFPELDRVAWMSLGEARDYMLQSQLPVLDALEMRLLGAAGEEEEQGPGQG